MSDLPPQWTRAAELPQAWTRTIANSIATELRHGWRINKATRAIHPTGAPRTGADKITSGVPKPLPNTEILWAIPYAFALTDPTPALAVPMLAWHLTQTDLAAALLDTDLMQHAEATNRWLHTRPPRGPAPAPFTLKTNRHGTLALRVNTEHVTREIATVLEAAATAATVAIPDPLDVNDALAAFDTMRPSIILGPLSSPRNARQHAGSALGGA